MDISPAFRVRSDALNKALGEMLKSSKRSLVKVMEEQARLFTKALIEATPPGGKGKSMSQAKKSGEANIAYDLNSIMTGVRARRSVTSDDIEGIHKSRIFQGTVRRVPEKDRKRVPIVAMRAYLKKVQGKVGILASGWARAATRYGYKPPAWITRHAGQGSGNVSFVDGRIIRLKVENPIRYASQFRWIINTAFSIRIRNIWRREAKFRGTKAIENAGRAAGVGK